MPFLAKRCVCLWAVPNIPALWLLSVGGGRGWGGVCDSRAQKKEFQDNFREIHLGLCYRETNDNLQLLTLQHPHCGRGAFAYPGVVGVGARGRVGRSVEAQGGVVGSELRVGEWEREGSVFWGCWVGVAGT